MPFGAAGADRPDVVVTVQSAQGGSVTVRGSWQPRVVAAYGPGSWTLELRDEGLRESLTGLVPPPRVLAAHRERVTLTVDGQPAEIDVGRRALRRATFHVGATVGDRRYRLWHTGRRTASFERDGVPLATLRRGPDDRPVQVESWAATGDLRDLAVAALLGCALQVGARGVVGNVLAGL